MGVARGVSLLDGRGEEGEETRGVEGMLCTWTAGDIGRGGNSDGLGNAGTGGGASEVVRMLHMELRLLRVLATEFFLLAAGVAGVGVVVADDAGMGNEGGDFIEKPDRVRPVSPPASHVAAFWGAVLGRSRGAPAPRD